ncbi:MAG TPA: hypothetical protein VE631_07085 [Alphaproteobacteria bacterium]|nr:hypothetical protein [Alphaproteobacteria bacterium]
MPQVFFIAGLLAFLFCLDRLRVVAKVKAVGRRTREALDVMRDDALPERRKEALVQQAAVRMGGAFVDILLRSATAFLVPLALVWGGTLAGLYSTDDALGAAESPAFLALLTALAFTVWFAQYAWNRSRR